MTYDTIAGSGGAWLLFLGIFMLGTWIATQAVYDLDNVGRQRGLFGFAAVEAVISFSFSMYLMYGNPQGMYGHATVVTTMGFAGLTSRMDYQKRFIIPSTNRDGSYGRNHSHCCCTSIWRQSRAWFSVAMVALWEHQSSTTPKE